MSYLILLISFFSITVHAGRFVVEAKWRLNQIEMKKFRAEKFFKVDHHYLSKLYIVNGKKEKIQTWGWVKELEPTLELTKSSLVPPDRPLRPVGDELFPYQWGLLNQGQVLYREKDDIHSLPMKGVINKDVGWLNLLPVISKKRPVVAVLDSGIDLDHPDLKDNLWKNVNECGKDPNIDNDKNELAGDCDGWNFTEAIDSAEAKRPQDIDGHGTHVAGIIAASLNGSGIVGVAPNALILPVKVMKDSNSKSEIASSEAFARGLIYATDRGAQVINMSLGWPKSLETKYLRESVFYALSKGVIIVAAAGNNNNSEPLFPCAYEGVVCVAASTLDGNFAGFSNFGGHIDAIAPGEGILSTVPTIFEPEYFNVPGFDIKSGTSQSAPLVSGLLVNLLVLNPELKSDDIFARLYKIDELQDKKKAILGGPVVWDALKQGVSSPVIRPVLKRVRQIVVKSDVTDFKLIIPFKNYGIDSGSTQVTVTSLSKSVEFNSDTVSLPAIKNGETVDLSFDGRVLDLNQESNIVVQVTIDDGQSARKFLNYIPVVRDIRGDKKLIKSPFQFTDRAILVGDFRNGELRSFLNTVESVIDTGRHDFYLRRFLKDGENKKLEITIFNRKEDKYVQAPKLIFIDGATNLVNLIRVDLNLDGIEDYAIQTIVEREGKKNFVFSFYDVNGNDLWPKFQHAKLNLDVQIESLNDIFFIKGKSSVLGTSLLPGFFTTGQTPKTDQEVSFFNKYDISKKKQIYYLEPGIDNTLNIRSLTNKKWAAQVKTQLKSKWDDTVEVEQILPLSQEDVQNGQIRVVVSVGKRTNRKIVIHSFTIDSQRNGDPLPQLVLQTDEVDPLYSITPNGLRIVGDVYFNVYDRSRAKIVATKQFSQDREFDYQHQSETDLLTGHLVSFQNNNERINVIQTREELVSITESSDGSSRINSRPKLRYSFLTQKLLSEMYYPVVYNRNNLAYPALYVDSTLVTGNRVYLFESQNGKLVSSIRNSLIVPSNCKSLNPRFSLKENSHQFIFLCLEQKEFFIRSFDMN